jgi:phosphatidyl-N-methylethanolamine N-methyltransferase
VSAEFFLVAAALLSLERVCYVLVWRYPEPFRRICDRLATPSPGDPVSVLQKLFYGFKAIQLGVFFGWYYLYGNGSFSPLSGDILSLAIGGALIVAGQILNFSVFYRLGTNGVFYGNQFGYEIRWCREFPFSLLKHPQYVGTLFSIWGFFLAMRFAHDWYMLPSLETVYYLLGAYFEQ